MQWKIHILITISFILLGVGLLSGQDSIKGDFNTIKFNIVALSVNSISIHYEYDLTERTSVSMGVSLRPETDAPRYLAFRNDSIESRENRLNGISFTPDYRYYITQCRNNSVASGFYLGGYFRYSNLHYTSEVFNPVDFYSSASVDMRLEEYGIGFQVGYKISFLKHWSFDFLAFGPRVSYYTLNTHITNIGESNLPSQIQDYVNQKLDELGISGEVEFESNKTKFSSFMHGNFRYGILLGYSF